MNIEQHTLLGMSDEEKAEYDIWTELLDSRGYNLLLQFLQGYMDNSQAVIQNPNSWDEHLYHRGQRDALTLVFQLEAILEARIAEMEAQLQESEEEENDFTGIEL